MTIKRVDCLDGLRGIAALWVLVGHCTILTGWRLPILGLPDLGVDLFILLSGFVMVYQRAGWAKAVRPCPRGFYDSPPITVGDSRSLRVGTLRFAHPGSGGYRLKRDSYP